MSSEADKLIIRKAQSFQQSRKYDEALAELDKVPEHSMKYDLACVIKARVWIAKGRYPVATEILQNLLRRAPGYSIALIELATIDYYKKDYKAARDGFAVSVLPESKDANALYRYAHTLFKLNELQEANHVIVRLDTLFPGRNDVAQLKRDMHRKLLYLGISPDEEHPMRAEQIEAVTDLFEALDVRDRDAHTKIAKMIAALHDDPATLGTICVRMSMLADRHCDKKCLLKLNDALIEINPRNAKAIMYKGLALLRLGNLDEAQAHMSRAIALQDDLLIAHILNARIAFKREDSKLINSTVDYLYKHYPNEESTACFRVMRALMQGDFYHAWEIAEEGCQNDKRLLRIMRHMLIHGVADSYGPDGDCDAKRRVFMDILEHTDREMVSPQTKASLMIYPDEMATASPETFFDAAIMTDDELDGLTAEPDRSASVFRDDNNYPLKPKNDLVARVSVKPHISDYLADRRR